MSYMKKHGLQKVAAFDAYDNAIARFDGALGNVKLKIAGVEIDRQLARSVAPWLIIPLLAILLLRLTVTRRIVASLDDSISTAALLRSTPSSYVDEPHGRTRAAKFRLNGTAQMMPPLLVLVLIAWTPIPAGEIDWPVGAALIGLALFVLIVREHGLLSLPPRREGTT